jgi:hypothetical protein
LTLYLIAKGNTDSINTKRCKPPQGSILKVSAHTSSNLSTSEVYPEYTPNHTLCCLSLLRIRSGWNFSTSKVAT